VIDLTILPILSRVGILALAAFTFNMPCGAWRVRVPKRSVQWFLAIHAPIPFAFLLRRTLDLELWFVAVTLLFAVAGQLVGGKFWAPRTPDDAA